MSRVGCIRIQKRPILRRSTLKLHLPLAKKLRGAMCASACHTPEQRMARARVAANAETPTH
jgi:hypothetical protein